MSKQVVIFISSQFYNTFETYSRQKNKCKIKIEDLKLMTRLYKILIGNIRNGLRLIHHDSTNNLMKSKLISEYNTTVMYPGVGTDKNYKLRQYAYWTIYITYFCKLCSSIIILIFLTHFLQSLFNLLDNMI